jgi:hypothetical protein
MPTNCRNSSTFVACVVFLLSLWPALPATAQGVLKVDTLFRSYAPDVVRYAIVGVHEDTIIINGRYLGGGVTDGKSTFVVHVSTNGGDTFDSLHVIAGQDVNRSPRRGLARTSMMQRASTSTTFLARDGVNFTEQRVADYLDVEYAHGYFLHPTHPDTSFLLVRSSQDRYTFESILVHLWPNPKSGLVTVSTSNGYLNKNTGVEFYDALGRPYGCMTNLVPATENSYTIDVRKLAVGTY